MDKMASQIVRESFYYARVDPVEVCTGRADRRRLEGSEYGRKR